MTAVSDRLDAIQAQLDAATPGPWILRDCAPCTERGRMDVFIWGADRDSLIAHWCDDDPLDRTDAVFIAAAPENTRYLLDLARKQQAALEAVRAVHEPVDALMYSGSQQRKVQVCAGCGTDDGNWQRWPCPTVRALETKP